jgi:hypothetical protein
LLYSDGSESVGCTWGHQVTSDQRRPLLAAALELLTTTADELNAEP